MLCFSLSLNKIFLPGYYQKEKVQKLLSIYDELLGLSNIDTNTQKLRKIASDNGLTIYQLTTDGTTLSLKYPEYLSEDEFQEITDIIEEYYITKKKNVVSIIKKTPTYIICKTKDEKINSEYLDLFSKRDDQIIYMRLNLENIQDTVDTANTFLLYISLLAMFEGALIMVLVSSRFTKPILNLSELSYKLSKLDFTDKCEVGNNKDEISLLGNSINQMSTELENSILLLKNANEQLTKDIEEKEKIDEMRKSFISDISHEFKTPIALIQSYAEGLKLNVMDEEYKTFYCDVIIDESEKMNTLVKKMLKLSQLEYGYNQLHIEEVDIKQYIEDKLQAMSMLFNKNNITVTTSLHLQFVLTDMELLDEVLNNFLSNAIHHCEQAKQIHVKMEDWNDKIKISIFNTGTCIPDEDINNIWVKFYKVDKARTREYGGSGIGLSIVKAIMESMNQEYGCNNLKRVWNFGLL